MPEPRDPRTSEPALGAPDPRSDAERAPTSDDAPPGFVERRRQPRGPVQILVVIGSRRDATRVLPLVLALHDHPSLHPVVVCTGEQQALIEPIFQMAGIEADVDLGCSPAPDATTGDSDLNRLVTSVIERFDEVVRSRYGEPDGGVADLQRVVRDGYPAAVLVHGNTSSAMAAGIAAFHLRLPVVHLEAGQRSHLDTERPPDELNGQLLSRLACFHLAPTPRNGEHLVREGVPYDRVYVCGSTGIDAMRWAASVQAPPSDPAVAALLDTPSPLLVVTAHRREQPGGALERVAAGVASLAERRPDVRIVVPMHPDAAIRHRIVPHL
ncbi:MAG: UDP-N-acetylglucosamine 2-epimerase, partial [Actinobacteria bacterium]|nr:UDP-N-acetylglucosamine 2-epimerase [Actinomycetota bacterium]